MTMTELSDASHFSSIPNYNISYKKTRKMILCFFGVKTELADPKLAPHNWPDQNWLKQNWPKPKTGPYPKLAQTKLAHPKTGPNPKLAQTQNWPNPKLAQPKTGPAPKLAQNG